MDVIRRESNNDESQMFTSNISTDMNILISTDIFLFLAKLDMSRRRRRTK